MVREKNIEIIGLGAQGTNMRNKKKRESRK